MPDPSPFDRSAMLAFFENSSRMGGIVYSPNYRSLSVEIRPSRWQKRIWVGRLETLELAQYVADAVRHYLGMSPFHFREGVMALPAITCIGTEIGTPVVLSTQEMFAAYVSKIAKGEDLKPQRDDFISEVRKVVKHPDFPFLASPRTESIVLDDDDCDREDEIVFDEDAAKALQMSSHSGSSGVAVAVVQTHVAGPDSVGSSKAVEAYVPSFVLDSNGREKILRSEGQSIYADVFSMDDCPTQAEKIWIESIEALDKLTASGASTPSVESNDCEVCGDGYETSPVLDIPPILWPCASTSTKSFGTPVERPVPWCTALGSSSDWPSCQFTKKQRIEEPS